MVIAGKSLCFTGSMKWGRREVERFARERGGKVSHKVTGKTDYLVMGATSDSAKLADALSMGVEVVSADEFFAA